MHHRGTDCCKNVNAMYFVSTILGTQSKQTVKFILFLLNKIIQIWEVDARGVFMVFNWLLFSKHFMLAVSWGSSSCIITIIIINIIGYHIR